MKYILASVFADGSKTIEISNEEYRALQDARGRLDALSTVEEHVFLIFANFKAMEEFLHRTALDVMIFGGKDQTMLVSMATDFAKECISLLTAARLYIDTLKSLVREVTGDVALADSIIAATSRHFDSHFEYRLVEALRNYSQHKALPVHSATVARNTEGTLKTYHVDFHLLSRRLVKDQKFRAQTLAEIVEKGGKISVPAALRVYVSCLADIHDLARRTMRPSVEAADQLLERYRERWTSETSSSAEGVMALESTADNHEHESVVWLDPVIDERRKYLVNLLPLMNFGSRRVKVYP